MSKIELENPQAVQNEVREWEQREVKSFLAKQKERKDQFYTSGGFPVKRTYTVLDAQETPVEDVGLPGRFPFTRGPYPTMYRSRFWTMRQIAGFGTGEDTNKRFKYLISQGQTGLSVDFDMPTLMGYDSDHPMSEGEVGREGVAVDTVAGMEARYNPINISGYHISEAGSSPLHEVAFTLCNLITYVEEVTKTGMNVDEFAPRLAFFFVCQNDFFEEIAKFRAVRRAYAKIMRDRFGARNPESMRLRFHCQTAAASL